MLTEEQIKFIEEQKAIEFYDYFGYASKGKNYIKISVLLAIIFHIIILLIKFPEAAHYISQEPSKNITILRKINPVITKPKYTEPIKKFKTLPIPDPTPDEPEPIRERKIIEPKDITIGEQNGEDLFINYQTPSNYNPIPVRIKEKGQQAILIYKVEAEYPEEARRARIEGVVILEAVINIDGSVGEIEILKSAHKSLDEAAIKAVKQYKFIPAKINGKPVRSFFTVSITFTLH